VHIPKVKRKKWDAKSIKGLMVGYSGQKDGYRMWIPGTNTVYQSHNVKFKNEEIVTSKGEFVLLSQEPHENKPVKRDIKQDDPVSADESQSATQLSSHEVPTTVSSPEVSHLHSRESLKKPAWLEDYVVPATSEAMTVTSEPMTYTEAMLSNDHAKWQEAMNEEMLSLKENDV